MQVIPMLLLLVLVRLSEAGLLRAPRTESLNAQTFSEFQIITSGVPSPTPPPATFIISAPTSPTSTAQAQTALSYGFVAVVESASTSDPAPTAAPALNTDDAGLTIIQGGSKFVQTTFWACETFPLETHCGWHEPILDVSSAATPHPRGVRVRAGVIAAFAVGVLLWGF
ncbi:hypothetical protein F4782DRAFT_519981 [Xylaria castorea]|nr:hypothetical protein F4782DRAFT_519981 [Xylaria castorea]